MSVKQTGSRGKQTRGNRENQTHDNSGKVLFTDWKREKLAEGIAGVLGVKTAEVSHKLAEDIDILFLCDSVYWNGADGKVQEFLQNPGHRIGPLVNVSTAAFKESRYQQVKAIAEKAGIPVSPHESHCKGSFMALHKGRPNEENVGTAQWFAEQIAGVKS